MAKKVLVVKENVDITNMFRLYFRMEFGYETVVLNVSITQINEIEAACLEHCPKVLIVDIYDHEVHVNRWDKEHALHKAIKNNPNIESIATICLISREERSVNKPRYLSDEYFISPFGVDELGLAVQALMENDAKG